MTSENLQAEKNHSLHLLFNLLYQHHNLNSGRVSLVIIAAHMIAGQLIAYVEFILEGHFFLLITKLLSRPHKSNGMIKSSSIECSAAKRLGT
jgi:hypothetical protein